MGIENLSDFGQYGTTGICLILIAALVYLMKRCLDIFTVYIKNHTEIMIQLKTLIEERLKK